MAMRFGVVGIAAALIFASIGAATAGTTFAGTFSDDDGNVHEANIEAIAAADITRGCNPPTNDLYCPEVSVTRGQMAAFLNRALTLPGTTEDFFSDDDGSAFENDINRMAAAGITKGCNPPANDRFCPDGKVTREQMAALLTRAFEYTDDGGGGLFTDTAGSTFSSDIDKLATAGVTLGCNPPDNDRFCPSDLVQRDQMASFLTRALGLSPIPPSPPGVAMCDDVTSIPVPECQALVSLYGATNGAGWTDNTGWL
ncbi:MAG: S-layer homology domain-containing protein, partial [Actinobacteria bacterium]|nr:S-layer homology domain-containing protein [Actinomycetota bacterium]